MAAWQTTTYAFSQSTADDYELVAAQSGKQVAVVGYHLAAAGTNTVKFTSQISDEVQTVTVTATGGTFTLTFDGQETSALAYNASAATVATALKALSNIGDNDVSVTKSGTTFTVAFIGALADTNVAALTADGTSLTGTGAEVVVATVTGGGTKTDLTGPIPTVAGSQLSAWGSVDSPLFVSGADSGLSVTLGSSNSIAGWISYLIIPA